jgi:hypothetical protein
MHNKTYAAEYVTSLPEHEAKPAPMALGFGRVTWWKARLTRDLQDRPQRLLAEARRHHRAGEAIRCQGHQRQGEGHDGGLNGGRQPWGKFFLCFGASQAVLGKGLLFVCDCLAPTRASEYNCGLLRHGQNGQQSTSVYRGFSAGVGREMFLGLSGNELTKPSARWLRVYCDDSTGLGWAIKIIPPFRSDHGDRHEHQHSDEEIKAIRGPGVVKCIVVVSVYLLALRLVSHFSGTSPLVSTSPHSRLHRHQPSIFSQTMPALIPQTALGIHNRQEALLHLGRVQQYITVYSHSLLLPRYETPSSS